MQRVVGRGMPASLLARSPTVVGLAETLASMPAADPTSEFAIPRAPFTAAQKAAGVPCSLRQEDMARRFLVRLCRGPRACCGRSSCRACDTDVVLMSSRRCGCLDKERHCCIVNICCAHIDAEASALGQRAALRMAVMSVSSLHDPSMMGDHGCRRIPRGRQGPMRVCPLACTCVASSTLMPWRARWRLLCRGMRSCMRDTSCATAKCCR